MANIDEEKKIYESLVKMFNLLIKARDLIEKVSFTNNRWEKELAEIEAAVHQIRSKIIPFIKEIKI